MNKAMSRPKKAKTKGNDEYTFEEYLREFVPSMASKFMKPAQSRSEQLQNAFRGIMATKLR